MKKIISLLLVLVMVFSMTAFASAATPFDDTYYSKNREAIEALYGLGILEGYGNGKYGPGNTLTRAEACAIIVRAMVEDDLIYESRVNTFTSDSIIFLLLVHIFLRVLLLLLHEKSRHAHIYGLHCSS